MICGGEGTYGGALTYAVNDAVEEKSGGGGVYLVTGRVDVRVGCPGCSRRSLPGASSLAIGASGGAEGCASRPCWTSYLLSSCYYHCC